MLEKYKNDLLRVIDKTVDAKLVKGAFGNFSVRDPKTNLVVVTPSSSRSPTSYDSMTTDDLIVVDLEGNIKEGKWWPTSEIKLHVLIYKNRPEMNGIVRTHSVYATTMTILGLELPIIVPELGEVSPTPVPIAEYHCSNERILEVMGDRDVVLLGSNGVIALGVTIDKAFLAASIVEDSAKMYIHARNIGDPIVLPEKAWEENRKDGLRWTKNLAPYA
jgi:L-fuculose-phosphate aldolase